MKLICLVFCALLATCAALTSEQRNKLKTISKNCRQEIGLSDADFETNISNKQFDDPKMKQNMLCVFKKVGIADENGDISTQTLKDRLVTAVNATEADAIIKKCVVKKSTPEDTVFNLLGCLKKNGPEFSPVA